MQLLELSANKPSFKKIEFKPGVNFIVGGKSKKEGDKKNTYNGVGKSLMIVIIHFCLGSRKIKDFENKLNDWEFNLKFKIANEEFLVVRKCNSQDNVTLNGTLMSLDDYKNMMGEKLFNTSSLDYQNLKFRPLISRFIRPNKFGYSKYDSFINKEQEYAKLLCNSYLLGLDLNLIKTKKDLICRKDEIVKAKKTFEKDETLHDFFGNEKNIDVSIINLEKNISNLKKEIKDFKVADNYYQIKKDADLQTKQLNYIENDMMLIKSAISRIDESINIKPDISSKKIEQMYREAKVEIEKIIIKKLEEVEEFNNRLLENRLNRLIKQKEEFNIKMEEKEEERKKLSKELDDNLKVLGTCGALEEYKALNDKVNILQNKLDKLNEYKKLIEKYKDGVNYTNIELQKENIKTNEYLKESKEVINKNILVFRELAQRFYPNKTSGIQISNNESDRNMKRFDISAEIQDDSSDGVNGVKIFCYDYTVMINNFNNNVRCMCHDSRLFADTDPRQKSECIKVADEYASKYNFQYIATLNEDFLDSIKGGCSISEYEEVANIINSNTRLHLTDDNETGKLLGIQLDLKYE